jgi:hypothetical protein
MASQLIDLLINPDAFFQKRMAEKENLVIPTLIILAGAIIGAASGYLTSTLTSQMIGEAGFGTGFVVFISVIGAFIGVFVYWAIATGIFYLISMLFEGKGSFSRSLEATGYGFLPLVFGYLVTFAVALVYIPRITLPQLSQESLKDPQAVLNATKIFMTDPTVVQFTRITMVVSILFLLWSTYCWIHGMKHARQMTLKNATICVGVPVFLYILYILAVILLSTALFQM